MYKPYFKQKYYAVVVKKKYRHFYFLFSKTQRGANLDSLERIRVWRFNFITLTQDMKVPLLKLLKKEKFMCKSLHLG